jgi:hypothetical protein
MPPIRLTDEQLDAIFRAARPLRVGDRDQFLQEVASALQGQDLGDGAVYRAIREVQRRHHDPPHPSTGARRGRRRDVSRPLAGDRVGGPPDP